VNICEKTANENMPEGWTDTDEDDGLPEDAEDDEAMPRPTL